MLIRLLVSSCVFYVLPSFSQDLNERAQILKPIETLFRAMELGDSSMLGTAFYSKASLATVILNEGLQFQGINFEQGLDGFKRAVSNPKPKPFREPIYDIQIQSEGPFAQVWARYAFYIGESFHHCGIDTFQLIRTNEGWKIFHLADTRQQKGCRVPKSVQKVYGSQ